ncbi:MAG: hypothetical protein ACJAS1_000822 [Oleiphilaceae bacterium]
MADKPISTADMRKDTDILSQAEIQDLIGVLRCRKEWEGQFFVDGSVVLFKSVLPAILDLIDQDFITSNTRSILSELKVAAMKNLVSGDRVSKSARDSISKYLKSSGLLEDFDGVYEKIHSQFLGRIEDLLIPKSVSSEI